MTQGEQFKLLDFLVNACGKMNAFMYWPNPVDQSIQYLLCINEEKRAEIGPCDTCILVWLLNRLERSP